MKRGSEEVLRNDYVSWWIIGFWRFFSYGKRVGGYCIMEFFMTVNWGAWNVYRGLDKYEDRERWNMNR